MRTLVIIIDSELASLLEGLDPVPEGLDGAPA